MRTHITTLVWYADRLSSLSSPWLVVVSFLSLGGLGAAGMGIFEFLDDLTFLVSDTDLITIGVLLGLLLFASAAIWLLSCTLGALGRRLILYVRGL